MAKISKTVNATPEGEEKYYSRHTGAQVDDAVDKIDKCVVLDNTGKIPAQYLPSFVDDVLEFPEVKDFPEIGESGKIYIAIKDNTTYRWSGSQYTPIGGSLALGHTSATAFPGNEGYEIQQNYLNKNDNINNQTIKGLIIFEKTPIIGDKNIATTADISAEEQARTQADNSLTQKITTETSNRETADNILKASKLDKLTGEEDLIYLHGADKTEGSKPLGYFTHIEVVDMLPTVNIYDNYIYCLKPTDDPQPYQIENSYVLVTNIDELKTGDYVALLTSAEQDGLGITGQSNSDAIVSLDRELWQDYLVTKTADGINLFDTEDLLYIAQTTAGSTNSFKYSTTPGVLTLDDNGVLMSNGKYLLKKNSYYRFYANVATNDKPFYVYKIYTTTPRNIVIYENYGGSLTVNKDIAFVGDSIIFTATPHPQYQLVSLLINGVNYIDQVEDNTLNFTMIDKDLFVTAGFKTSTDDYYVYINQSVNGTVVTNKNHASEGEVVRLTITPENGYMLSKIFINGQDYTPQVINNILSFVMPSSDAVIEPSFRLIPLSNKEIKYYIHLNDNWVQLNPTSQTYMDLISNQIIDGEKTFSKKIKGLQGLQIAGEAIINNIQFSGNSISQKIEFSQGSIQSSEKTGGINISAESLTYNNKEILSSPEKDSLTEGVYFLQLTVNDQGYVYAWEKIDLIISQAIAELLEKEY